MDAMPENFNPASSQNDNGQGDWVTVRRTSRAACPAPSTTTVCTQSQHELARHVKLGAVVFGCTDTSYPECMANKLFCASYFHWHYIKLIEPGMPLFLFNFISKDLMGVFEAASYSMLNFESNALMQEGSTALGYTKFPAQVQVRLMSGFSNAISIPKSVFKKILIENYWSDQHFSFQLDGYQTRKLIEAFRSKAQEHFRATSSVSRTLAIQQGDVNSFRMSSTLNQVIPKGDHTRIDGNPELGAVGSLGRNVPDAPKLETTSLYCPQENIVGEISFLTGNNRQSFYHSRENRNLPHDCEDLEEDGNYPNAKFIIASILRIIDDYVYPEN